MSPLPVVCESLAILVTPCADVDLPGYLILRPKQTAGRLAQLPKFAAELGPMLAVLEQAIHVVTGAPRVYVLRFSEAQDSVHFHLFPRTAALTAAYATAFPARAGNVVGPELFEWARQRYAVDGPKELSGAVAETALAIRAALPQG